MRTTSTSFPVPRSSASNEQPTPQYPQVVLTERSAWPRTASDFSNSAPVGQDSTHAPQETHSESMNGSCCLAETREAKPRFSIVSAKVPCTSSHARTQREQTMHRSLSKRKYGLLLSTGFGVAWARAE